MIRLYGSGNRLNNSAGFFMCKILGDEIRDNECRNSDGCLQGINEIVGVVV